MPVYFPTIAGISASNSVFSSGTVRFTGGNNITVGTDASGVSFSGPNLPAAQTGISGISASDSVFTSGTVRFTGGPNVTVGTDASGVSFSGANPVSAGIGGAAASNTTYTSGTVVFTGGPGITVGSDTGQKISFSAGAAPTLSAWKRGNLGTNVLGIGTTHQQPLFFPLATDMGPFPGNMTASSMGMLMSWSTAATSVSQQLSSTLALGIYTLNAKSLSLISSATVSFGNAAAATINGSNRWHGLRLLTFAPPNGISTYSNTPYWMGMLFSSHVTTIAGSLLNVPNDFEALTTYQGIQGNSATAATDQPLTPFKGAYTATSASLPSSVTQGHINQVTAISGRVSPILIFNNIFIP